MFGLCALNKKNLVFILVLLLPFTVWSQQVQKGTVINDGAMVYQDADFDAPVIDTLKRGAVHSISKGTKGPFHKIRLNSGSLGWIADTDIKLGVLKLASVKKEKTPEQEERERRKKPFFATRYRGPTFEFINFSEETLGKERSANLVFYGIKFNGYNTIFDGDIYADANIIFHSGAPDYYQSYTKKSADGMILIANFLLQTTLPQSKWHLVYYGFGPMFRYSNFNLEVPNGTKTTSYTAADMSLGALFDLGLAFRIGSSLSLRADAKYYWEKTQYYGLGLNLGWEF